MGRLDHPHVTAGDVDFKSLIGIYVVLNAVIIGLVGIVALQILRRRPLSEVAGQIVIGLGLVCDGVALVGNVQLHASYSATVAVFCLGAVTSLLGVGIVIVRFLQRDKPASPALLTVAGVTDISETGAVQRPFRSARSRRARRPKR